MRASFIHRGGRTHAPAAGIGIGIGIVAVAVLRAP
jgi:hypothetical protein